MRIPLLVTFFLPAALALIASAAEPALPESLLANGDFETDTAGAGWPDGWAKKPGISWEVEEGKHFMRLVSQEPGQMLMLHRAVPISAGVTGLEVTLRYRTAGVAKGAQPWYDARAIFHFLDPERKQVKPDPKPLIFSTKATEWMEVSTQMVVPDGATQLEMMPSLFQVAEGTLDLAEIRVTAIDGAAMTTAGATK